jgi:hypothetical protein
MEDDTVDVPQHLERCRFECSLAYSFLTMIRIGVAIRMCSGGQIKTVCGGSTSHKVGNYKVRQEARCMFATFQDAKEICI